MLSSNLLLSAFLSLVAASPIYKREEPITNSTVPKYIEQSLIPGANFKAIQLSIGSNNQTLLLKLDTTTADFWVNSDLNEYCSAYYSIPNYFNNTSNAAEWNEFNNELRTEFDESIEAFEINNFESLTQVSGSSVSEYLAERKTAYNSVLSEQKASVTKQIDEFLSTATSGADQDWNEFTSDIPSAAEAFGNGITSNGGLFATKVTSWGESIATDVTSIGGQVITLVTKRGGEFASDFTSEGGVFASHVTSEGGLIATRVTSWGGNVATKVTSGFGVVTSDVVNGWDALTSEAAGWFRFAKREHHDESSSKHSSMHHTSMKHSSASASPSTMHHSSEHVVSVSKSVAESTTVQDFIPQETFAYGNITFENATIPIDEAIYKYEHDCSLYGVYNDSASDSFSSSSEYFVSYDDSYAFGFLANDTVGIADVKLNATFGVADASESNIGVLGLGQSNNDSSFASFPEVLAENGAILKALYSLYVNSLDSKILFGAIDYGFIDSNITFFPLLNDTEAIAFNISALNITIFNEDDNSNDTVSIGANEAQAVVDIASSGLSLPEVALDALVFELGSIFDVSYNTTFGRYIININSTESNEVNPADIYFSIDIEDSSVEVPLSNFLVPFYEEETVYFNKSSSISGSAANSSFYFNLVDDESTETYILSILPSYDNNTVVLGLDFFKDTLVTIVDLEEHTIGFADSILDLDDYESLIVIIEDDIPNFGNSTDVLVFDDDDAYEA